MSENKTFLTSFELKILNNDKSKYIVLERYHEMEFIPQIGMEVDFEKEPMLMSLIVDGLRWSTTGFSQLTVKLRDQQYHHDDWDRILEHYYEVRRNMTYVPGNVLYNTRWKIKFPMDHRLPKEKKATNS